MFFSIKHKIDIKSEIFIILVCLTLAFIYTFCLNIPYKFLVSAFFILYLSRFNRITAFATATLYAIISFLFPITINYGVPTKSHFFNMFNSNIEESKEFIGLIISVDAICIILTTIFLLIVYTIMCCKLLTKSKSSESFKSTNKTIFHKAFTVILVAIIIFIGVRCYPTKLFPDSIQLTKVALSELDDFNKAVNKPTDIEIIRNDKKIKNVVVIIGESVETDYLSVMGYPHPTTPNLDKLNGHFYKNNISASSYTIQSLMHTLTLSPDKTTYELNNNIVNLANKAGFTTYYFSLESDSEKELLNDYFASLSKFNKYKLPKAKSLDSTPKSKGRNIEWQLLQNRNDDFKLLSLFDIAISDQEEYRMIFLHMIGHHPNVCHRLRSYTNIFKDLKHTIPNNSPDELNCYLSVTHKLDYFISHINNKLTELGEPYYLFYLSDHGLLFDLDSKLRTFIHHGHEHKSNFRAPLIVLSSEIKTHEVIEDYISGYDFMNNFINYLNVDTNIIKAKGKEELRKDTLNDIDVFVNDKVMKYSEMNDFKIYY